MKRFTTENLFELFSQCTISGQPYINSNQFQMLFEDKLNKIDGINLEGLYLSMFNRLPYKDEFEHFKKSGSDIANYAFKLISSPKFIKNVPKILKTISQFDLTYFAHVPKTGGTSIINNIEKYTSIPTWSLDYDGGAAEIYEKLPYVLNNINSEKKFFVRSHYSISDTNELIELRKCDHIIATVRSPLDICISNVNYITNRITNKELKKHGDWEKFYEINYKDPVDFAIYLIQSKVYKEKYANLLSGTLSLQNYDVKNAVASGYLKIIEPKTINRYLQENFCIDNPEKFNETPIKYLNLSQIDKTILMYLKKELVDIDIIFWPIIEEILSVAVD